MEEAICTLDRRLNSTLPEIESRNKGNQAGTALQEAYASMTSLSTKALW